MIDAIRLLDATTNTDDINILEIVKDRFKGLLHDQPDKLSSILSKLDNAELNSVVGKSLNLQIFAMNDFIAKLLYRFSGRTGLSIGTVRVALVDDVDLKTWLNLIDMGVLPVFVTHDVV